MAAVPADDLPDQKSAAVPEHDLPDHLAAAKPAGGGGAFDAQGNPSPNVIADSGKVEPPHSSPIGHIASAIGGAFAPPYGLSDDTLRAFNLDSWVNPVGLAARGASATLDALGRPVQALGKGAAAGMGEVARATGGNPEEAERDTNLIGDVTGLVMGQSPATGMPKKIPPGPVARSFRINASDQAKDTIGAGFVLPPAEASEGHIGEVNLANMAAGEAGKIKLGQLAAAKNQPLVNMYAQKELGLKPGTVLSPETFRAVREREGKVYQEVVDAVPEIDLGRDKDFRAAVDNVGARSAETERLFPSTKEPPGVQALRSELVQNSRGSTRAVLDYIANLRSQATSNFQVNGEGAAMAHRMGAAQRQAANALEEAVDRSVANAPQYYRDKLADATAFRDQVYAERADQGIPIQGPVVEMADKQVQTWSDKVAAANAKDQANQTLLDRYRNARQTIAKSYDVESATNVSTGDVNARGLGKLAQQGKPLSGALKLIADSANSFHRAFQNPASFGGVESYSVLDAAGAAAMALSGHPIAATIVGARPILRSRQLSPWYQRRMISEPSSAVTSGSAALTRAGTVSDASQGLLPPDNAAALGGP